jgi:Putative beta-barrel porin-2, OmpL-like. bbp2
MQAKRKPFTFLCRSRCALIQRLVRIVASLTLVVYSHNVSAQVTNTGLMDTTAMDYKGKISVGGYVDTYYGYDFNRPSSGDRPYFVSSARHNEFNINLAYIDLKYSSARLRARFVPGAGTYMNSNYAHEPNGLKNLVEATIGVRLFADKQIWLDMGVLGSPYTNESYVSKDHIMYTRSLGAENAPYYLSGLKLTLPLTKKFNAYFYLLNGWQQITDQNSGKSLGTQVEFRPTNNLLINWDTYIGDERTSTSPQNRTRYFTDVYLIYVKQKFTATACAYLGIQNRDDGIQKTADTWWHFNVCSKYTLRQKISLSGRVEYFNDPHSVMVTPITSVSGFTCASASLGVNFQIAQNVIARFEGRDFLSDRDVFIRNNVAVKDSQLAISSITLWF